MLKRAYSLALMAVLLPFSSIKSQDNKIVCVGGTITEIVVALGFEDQIVGIDQTSTFPESIKTKPSVGYRNSIQAEGILSLKPTVIIYQKGYLKLDVERQLNQISLKHLGIAEEHSVSQAKETIMQIASLLNVESKGAALIKQLDVDEERLKAYLKANKMDQIAKVLFIYARGAGNLMVSGENTFAESIINLAGGELAIENIEGFKPIDYETVLTAKPTHLLYFKTGLQSFGGVDAVLKHPIFSKTPTGQNTTGIISMDGLYLSGFGPRVNQAALDLAKMLYPTSQKSTKN